MAMAFLMVPFSSPCRISSRFAVSDCDGSSRAKFLIEHFERHSPHHLQLACLAALHLSDSSAKLDCHRDNGSLSTAAASLLGLLHSLNSVVAFKYARSRQRNWACKCVADHGSSYASEEKTEDARSTWLNIDGLEEVSSDSNGNSNGYLDAQNSNRVRQKMIDSDGRTELMLNETRTSNLISSADTASIPAKEPIYEVLEVRANGIVITKAISRRALLKTSGLRLRDIRSVDPSLWVTNSAPALLIRDQAILLNLGSLRAIASADSVLIFDHRSVGAVVFLELLLQRLNPDSNPGVPAMPFELEVMEAALLSRTQRLERRLMEVEPRVLSLLEVLPNCLTANVLEELRLSKQALVELGSKANALRQMLLELLESPQEIRRMTIMGRRCTIRKEDGSIECIASSDKQLADDEEEEMEMLLENYLQRCESCHGQAERLLDSAKEMEDSIAVNLSSRRLEVSRLELLLQVGTFCAALGALVAGVFGMNLKSYLEGSAFAFWLTTAGIVLGGVILFFIMYNHLKQRKVL